MGLRVTCEFISRVLVEKFQRVNFASALVAYLRIVERGQIVGHFGPPMRVRVTGGRACVAYRPALRVGLFFRYGLFEHLLAIRVRYALAFTHTA